MAEPHPPVELVQLGPLSATRAERLPTCGLRADLSVSPSTERLRRTATAMALGSAVHSPLDQAQYLHLAADTTAEEWIDSAWQAEIKRAWDRVAADSPFADPPEPERWPGYQRARVRVSRML